MCEEKKQAQAGSQAGGQPVLSSAMAASVHGDEDNHRVAVVVPVELILVSKNLARTQDARGGSVARAMQLVQDTRV